MSLRHLQKQIPIATSTPNPAYPPITSFDAQRKQMILALNGRPVAELNFQLGLRFKLSHKEQQHSQDTAAYSPGVSFLRYLKAQLVRLVD